MGRVSEVKLAQRVFMKSGCRAQVRLHGSRGVLGVMNHSFDAIQAHPGPAVCAFASTEASAREASARDTSARETSAERGTEL